MPRKALLAYRAGREKRRYLVCDAWPVHRLPGPSVGTYNPLVGGMKFFEDVLADRLGYHDPAAKQYNSVVDRQLMSDAPVSCDGCRSPILAFRESGFNG